MTTILTSTTVEPQGRAEIPSLSVSTPKPVADDERNLTAEDYLNYEAQHSLEGMTAHPVVMTKGQGSFLWDMSGKRYIDFNAGFSACNQGHCHPKIVAAMMKQCQELVLPSRSVHQPQYALLCKTLSDLTGFDKVGTMNGGAEAVDLAIKISRAWGYKKKGIKQDQALVITASNNYHGRTLSILSASTDQGYRQNQGPWMPNVGPSCAGNEVRFGEIQDLKQAFDSCGKNIAAFVVECVQGHAGCLAGSDDYLQAVRELCDEYNVLFVADEIQAGLGRTGMMFSYESAGVKPDMVILGKSLAGGFYPISAVVGNREVMDSIDPGQYGSTFSGNPLASAVAIAALEVIVEESLPSKAAHLGSKFEARFRAIKSPYFDTITGKGLFRSIYIHETHPKGWITGKRLAALCLQRGLLVNAMGRRLRVCPALVIDENVMLEGIGILEKALNDLENGIEI